MVKVWLASYCCTFKPIWVDAPLKKQTNHSETHFGRHASYHFCCAIRGRGNSLAACGHVLAPLCLCSIGAPWCLNDLDLATVIPGQPMKYHSNLLTPGPPLMES